MFHVTFSDTTRIALTSPITEVVHQELKDTGNKAELEKVMADYIEHAHGISPADEHQPFVFGETRESAGTYFFLGGWTTKDVSCFFLPITNRWIADWSIAASPQRRQGFGQYLGVGCQADRCAHIL